MATIKRELEREEMLKQVRDALVEEILQLPIGTLISIAQLVNRRYGAQGYQSQHLGVDIGYVWTKDNGATYLLSDADLFEVMDVVQLALRGIRTLDFSAHADQLVGLPYDLPFEILEDSGIPVVSVMMENSRVFQMKEVQIVDSPENNLLLHRMNGVEEEPTTETYTISSQAIGKLKEECAQLITLAKEAEEEEDNGFGVMDGIQTTVTLYTPEGDTTLFFWNLWTKKEALVPDSVDAGSYALAEEVFKLASAVSGKRITLSDFCEELE